MIASHSLPRSLGAFIAVFAAALLVSLAGNANSKEPGRGKTGPFEVKYLEFIIDHHYSALRTTELAAGTDLTRDEAITSTEGTSPTPQTSATPAKADLDAIKSMARMANRVQREEILKAQRFLRDWYGIERQPRLRDSGRQLISELQKAEAGREFDKAFLRLFSRHHYLALGSTIQCLTGADIDHVGLERYCQGIVSAQVREIDEMRHMLCEKFSDCDYQPFGPSSKGHRESETDWAHEAD
ncbi:MAG: hypothetical protein ABS69_00120 [Nitrosomonadales bacterium SCN 54-20]|nr:MAG: hypothetical protein ABS69_00120 [Nitrosomonadales bacterium SCN 54-20]